MAYQLPPLPYDYSALEPFIDTDTMKFHHDKHHQTYVTNANAAFEKHPELASKSVDDLLKDLAKLPEDVKTALQNNAGGHSNHSIFWTIMGPAGTEGIGCEPTGAIADQITEDFGSFEELKKTFNDAGAKRFGSGWAWVVWDNGKLKVISTANQDSPFTLGLFPIFGNDVWEHAYYLKYQNLRAKYLDAWWNVVNWAEVNRRFKASKE